MTDPRDNPMYGLLQARRQPVWDAGLVAVTLLAAVLGLGWGPQVTSAVFVSLFAVLRSSCEASRLASLVQGRGIEEVLMARTRVHELLDGMCLYCLQASARPSLGCWLWLLVLAVTTGEYPMALATLVGWLPCLVVTLASSCYLAQLGATGTLGRRFVPTVLIPLWLGLLLALAMTTMGEQYAYVPVILTALAGVAWLARAYTGAALLDRLTPAPSQVRTLSPYRPWWPEQDPIALREACREHHRGQSWLAWVSLALVSALAFWLGEGGLWLVLGVILVPLAMIWAAYRTSPSIAQEREARTLDVMALTRLRSEQFVDGWAAHGWRPLAWRFSLPAAAVALTSLSSPYSNGWETAIATSLYWGLLVAVAQAGSYIGVWASARAGGSRAQLSANLLGSCALAWVMLVMGGWLLSLVNLYALPVWPWLCPLLLAFLYRLDTLQHLTVEGAHPARGRAWPLLTLLPLGVPTPWLSDWRWSSSRWRCTDRRGSSPDCFWRWR